MKPSSAPETLPDDHEPPPPQPFRRARWLFIPVALGLWFALDFVAGLVRWLLNENSKFYFIGLDGMRWPMALSSLVSVGLMGLLFWKRPRWSTLAIVASLGFAGSTTFFKVFRIESYYGNRTPHFTWRWKPTAEEKIAHYLVSSRPAKRQAIDDAMFQSTPRDFPGFLGARRDAQIDPGPLALDWNRKPPTLLWRHPVGLGWSGFAVVGQAAVNLEQRDDKECVVCYDLRSGNELWSHQETTRFKNDHGDGPRTIPSIANGRVYAMGGTGILTCTDLVDGSLLWKQEVFKENAAQNLYFGMSGSPLIFDDRVLIAPGAGKGASAICYSAENGSEIWRSGDDPAAYASPIETSLGGKRQLLSFNGAGLRSYDLDGKELWLQSWQTQGESRVNVAQPVIVDANPGNGEDGAKVLISSGYDKGTALLKIAMREGRWTSEILWTSNQLKSKLSNFVVVKNHLYGFDNGLLTCLDLDNGKRTWKRGRYGHGQMLLVGGNLWLQAESGEIVIVAANPTTHQELARFAPLESKTWNHPALAGNILVVRNNHEAAAFELPIE